jgi:hypothetical protein
MKDTSYLLVCFLPQHNVWAVIGYPSLNTLAMERDGSCREMTDEELDEYTDIRSKTDN